MKWFASARPADGVTAAEGGHLSDSAHKLHNSHMTRHEPHVLKPFRWLAHLPLAILPLLAAAVVEGPRLERDLQDSVTEALSEAGQGWARVLADGRDIEIRGAAPDKAAAEMARGMAAATFGVRRVAMHVAVVGP